METKTRKQDHIRICLEKDVQYRKSNGFDRYEFEHNALHEIDFEKIDTSVEFMGKKFSAPILIEAMTGGIPESEKINKNLAKAAQDLGLGMGVGSQRAALETPELSYTYKVRDVAPDIFLLGNIGAVQLQEHKGEARKLMDMIGADALAVHLNPAQEMAQSEGNRNFENVLSNINDIVVKGIPVIVKEVGCGISGTVARKLALAGVAAIDVAGAGGTSWVKVDYHRGETSMKNFLEWGMPTAECLEQCRDVEVPLIASGGIRTGMDIAKAIAMGASLAGMALPLLKPASKSPEAVKEHLRGIINELRITMLLVGAKNIGELRKARLVKI
jgi:isopentenyl-diphosphate delta-isomerase